MTSDKLLLNGTAGGMLQEARKKCPPFVAFLAVACTVLAGLGDWKVLNNSLGALPKAIVLGTIVCAFLNFLVAADFDHRHLKRNTAGSSNELSFDVLDAARSGMDTQKGSARRVSGSSTFTSTNG
jgi:hypothetical protein